MQTRSVCRFVVLRWRIWFPALAAVLLLAGCAGSAGPRLIAAAGTPLAVYPLPQPVPPPQDVPLGQWIFLELETANVHAAAVRAVQLVEAHGGFLSASSSWGSAEAPCLTLDLVSPASQTADLRRALLRLGRERAAREANQPGSQTPPLCWNCLAYDRIVLTLITASPAWPGQPSGWSPARTFSRAFHVFYEVFTFVADLWIWALVLAGPFVLAGWLALRLRDRFRRRG